MRGLLLALMCCIAIYGQQVNPYPRPLVPSGSSTAGTVTVVGAGNLTSTALVTGGGSQSLQTPAAGATLDASGNLSTPGSISSGSGSGVAGVIDLGQGTLPALGTTAISLLAPTAVTSYGLKFPGAAPAASTVLLFGAPSSGVSTATFAPLYSNTLTALNTSQTAGYSLINSTAALVGQQQVSPGVLLRTNGWGTTGGASQVGDILIDNSPVKDTTVDPMARFSYQEAGGGYVQFMLAGPWPTNHAVTGLWVGNVAPTTTNYTILWDGSANTYIGSGTGTLNLVSGNTVGMTFDNSAWRVTNGKPFLSGTDGGASLGFSNAANRFSSLFLTTSAFIAEVAVASLATCNAANGGAHQSVNNSNAASFTAGIGLVVAAGGSTHVPVYCDGTSWRIG